MRNNNEGRFTSLSFRLMDITNRMCDRQVCIMLVSFLRSFHSFYQRLKLLLTEMNLCFISTQSEKLG